ncbi:hypothetical protein CSOJ01_10090 [Colletotrichum sojae]|uniref:Uncharacterized protein n=1 Tax=Colletotrichum sojae TaxID=2175907 RepID=A0A8H6MQJ1_9PEZI|nr:hypothetical protein CSOJ01_10090 [Colletotrichum sojae]
MTLVEGGAKARRDGASLNRRAFDDFWPVPATTAAWPAVIYSGPNGKASTEMEQRIKDWLCRQPDAPSYYDMDNLDCPNRGGSGNNGSGQVSLGDGWDVPRITANGTMILPRLSPLEGFFDLLGMFCELEDEPTTTTVGSHTTQPAQPTAKPLKRPEAKQNKINCFNGGRKTTNVRMRNGIDSFCRAIGSDAGRVLARGLEGRAAGQLTGGYKKASIQAFSGQEEISFSFEVLDGCAWTFSHDECVRYLKTPVDSCNCGGTNGKQGDYGSNNCLKWKTDPNRSG